jgi:hypothetical protein
MSGKLASGLSAVRRSVSLAFRGEEKLWKVWWLAGIPLACMTGALVIAAERVRGLGTWAWGWGDACDAMRLLVYLVWFMLAWRCSKNVQIPVWTPLARVVLLSGLLASVMF